MLRTYRNWKHGLGTLSHWNGNGGKLDKYVGILRIVKNALILINGNKIIFQMSVELYTGNYCTQRSYIHVGSYYTSTFKARRNLLLMVMHEYM